MYEENFTVTIDIAAPVAAKIEAVAAEYNGKYVLNDEVYDHVLNVYRKFRKFVVQNDGGIKNIDVHSVDKVKIVAEVPDVDLYREGLDLFSELLAMVDSMDVSVSKSGDLIIEVSVAGLWKAV